jgi:hypothetical protein
MTNQDNPDPRKPDYSVIVQYDGVKPELWDEIEDLNKRIEFTYGATIGIENTSGRYVTPHFVQALKGKVPTIEKAEVGEYGISLTVEIYNHGGYGGYSCSVVPDFVDVLRKWCKEVGLELGSLTPNKDSHESLNVWLYRRKEE